MTSAPNKAMSDAASGTTAPTPSSRMRKPWSGCSTSKSGAGGGSEGAGEAAMARAAS